MSFFYKTIFYISIIPERSLCDRVLGILDLILYCITMSAGIQASESIFQAADSHSEKAAHRLIPRVCRKSFNSPLDFRAVVAFLPSSSFKAPWGTKLHESLSDHRKSFLIGSVLSPTPTTVITKLRSDEDCFCLHTGKCSVDCWLFPKLEPS